MQVSYLFLSRQNELLCDKEIRFSEFSHYNYKYKYTLRRFENIAKILEIFIKYKQKRTMYYFSYKTFILWGIILIFQIRLFTSGK